MSWIMGLTYTHHIYHMRRLSSQPHQLGDDFFGSPPFELSRQGGFPPKMRSRIGDLELFEAFGVFINVDGSASRIGSGTT